MIRLKRVWLSMCSVALLGCSMNDASHVGLEHLPVVARAVEINGELVTVGNVLILGLGLNILGITASFVLYPDGDRVIISARSIGEANVQVILEALGGGGNAAAAGAQIPGKTVRNVLTELVASIDKFYEN